MKKIVVLVSGRGSNMVALLDACAGQRWDAQVVAVIADRAEAPACAAARSRGVRVQVIEAACLPDRAAFNAELARQLHELQPDLVVLAGFMRILPASLVERFQGRMLNIHPSLLPAYPGLHTHRRVLEGGARVHGATVHYVNADLDTGPIVIQAAVPVGVDDDAARLAERVLSVEHRILPLAVRWHLEGRLAIEGARVRLAPAFAGESQVLWQP